ncbi:MAG: hypothetical protein ACC661_12995, partial [Verrucomicrobiales bacterium]
PVRGDLIGIESIETFWKVPLPTDRVKPHQAYVPEISIRLFGDGGSAENPSYLRVTFRDDEGVIRGDVTAREVRGEVFAENDSPNLVILGTEGFLEPIYWTGYLGGGRELWTAEISEGDRYDATHWNRLAFITLPPKEREE